MNRSVHSLKFILYASAALMLVLAGSCNTGTPDDRGDSLVQFTTSLFAGSGDCAACHTNLQNTAGADISMDTQWRSTIMANAARDPYFLATVASEAANLPELAGAIEETCATCHMPMALTQAKVDGTSTNMMGNGFLNASNPLHKAAMDGTSCTLCHQIQAAGLGTAETFGGEYKIDTSKSAPDRVIYGPYANPLTDTMQQAVGFTPVQGAHMSEAALCAPCHTVYTPIIDASGNITGLFPEQVPYLEWKASAFGSNPNPAQQAPCQSCHMLPAGSGAIANEPSTLQSRNSVSRHSVVGGNSIILDIMSENVEQLGLTASAEQLAATAQLAKDQIGGRAGNISIIDSSIENGLLSVTLSVVNQTGHKFPTGFPSRRVWIHFTVTDSTGRVVFESGKPNADGSITGNDADASNNAFEPHYDIITSPEQVQIYEAIMADTTGKIAYNILKGASYLKDNRLLPIGFDKNNVVPDAAVHGDALTDANFVGGSDQVTYQVSLSGNGPYTVKAELLYQTISYQFARAFVGDSQLIKDFIDYYQAADKRPLLVSTVSKTLD